MNAVEWIAAATSLWGAIATAYGLIQAHKKNAAESARDAVSAELKNLRCKTLQLPDGTTIPMHLLLEQVKFANDSELYKSIGKQMEETVRRLALDQVVAIVEQVLGGKIVKRTVIADSQEWWIEVVFTPKDGATRTAVAILPVSPYLRNNAKS